MRRQLAAKRLRHRHLVEGDLDPGDLVARQSDALSGGQSWHDSQVGVSYQSNAVVSSPNVLKLETPVSIATKPSMKS
jgi:hypothetical protein